MAKFKIIVKRESFITVEVTAANKLEAGLLAQTKAKSREGWDNRYSIDKIEVL